MDAWKITIERIDPGATISEDAFNLGDPIADVPSTTRFSVQRGICQTTPANMAHVVRYLAALNRGYATGLAAVNSAIDALTP